MLRQKKVEELSVEELEKLLRVKRRQSRIERFQRLSQAGYSPDIALVRPAASSVPQSVPAPSAAHKMVASGMQTATVQPTPSLKQRLWATTRSHKKSRPRWMDRLLLVVEVGALCGLVAVLASLYFSLQTLNSETALAQQSMLTQQTLPAPTAVPPIALSVLPGGHSSPTSPEGVTPDVPLHLQRWVQPGQNITPANIPVESKAEQPTRIVIPKIGVDAPIVHGVDWEALKKGVGHLPGSANPGERGNLYLAAHNDIYGEIFRYLEDLAVGDEYFIYAEEQQFRYIVKERRIIEPTEVEVMLPTTNPVATLQTCYPYLINTQRLVVISELAQ